MFISTKKVEALISEITPAIQLAGAAQFIASLTHEEITPEVKKVLIRKVLEQWKQSQNNG